jgi:hypothetical protein
MAISLVIWFLFLGFCESVVQVYFDAEVFGLFSEGEIVRVEAPPQPTADRGVKCVSCGGSLRSRQGMFVLKYFLVERPRRRAQKR